MANTVCILLSQRCEFDVRGGKFYISLFVVKSVLNKLQASNLKGKKKKEKVAHKYKCS